MSVVVSGTVPELATADAGRTALPNLARQFDLMAKGCRAHGLDSWEDHFFRLYEEARDGKISAEEIAETIDYDYRNEIDGKAAATQIITALLADVAAAKSVSTSRPFHGAECPSYPNCTGGCGLGCTHEIESNRADLAAAKGAGR